MRLIRSFVPSNPWIISRTSARRLELDFDVDAGGEVEAHQCIHRARTRLQDVDQSFVRAQLELLAGIFIDEGPSDHGELLELRRQGDWPRDLRASALSSLDD